ncbi:hypothetical protein ACJ41O_010539 [Fusarium nematophilum]
MARRARGQVSPSASLELGWDVQARYAFFSTFVSGFSFGFGAVVPSYTGASSSSHLVASVEATSLAFLATSLNRPDLLRLASRSYVTAIQRLSRALSGLESIDPVDALESILLLDQYEKMVCRTPRGSASWTSHARGGICLIESFWDRLMIRNTGRGLAARVVSALTVSCGATAVGIPDELVVLRARLDPLIPDVKWRFMDILASVVSLQAELAITGGRCSLSQVQRAEQLDSLLAHLQQIFPLSWRPRPISPVGDDPLIFGSHYEIFPSHFITQLTTGCRVVRLILNKILSAFAPNDARIAAIYKITHEICATVPPFVLPDAQHHNATPFSPVRTLQCCTLLAPLYLANQVCGDPRMRSWIRCCLEYMAERGGMKMAQEVGDLMSCNPDLDYWFIVATVGSYAFAT